MLLFLLFFYSFLLLLFLFSFFFVCCCNCCCVSFLVQPRNLITYYKFNGKLEKLPPFFQVLIIAAGVGFFFFFLSLTPNPAIFLHFTYFASYKHISIRGQNNLHAPLYLLFFSSKYSFIMIIVFFSLIFPDHKRNEESCLQPGERQQEKEIEWQKRRKTAQNIELKNFNTIIFYNFYTFSKKLLKGFFTYLFSGCKCLLL